MSLIDHPTPSTAPPLVAGERLDRATFHNRYEQMPEGTRAELVGGVVYMPSPLRLDHGDTNHCVDMWLGYYEESTSGVRTSLNASTFLCDEGEPQPDLLMRILPECGGQTRVIDGYLDGPPELVVEISRSSRTFDLGPKYLDYERAGVLEYIVVGLEPDEVFWHVRRDDRFARVAPDADGLFRSAVFPGLWLDPEALFASDRRRLRSVVEQGVATPEHAAFVAKLAAAKQRSAGDG
jgi:Uma2 family endonuclease